MRRYSKKNLELSPKKRALLEKLIRDEGFDATVSPVIPRRADPSRAQVSFAQQRLWFVNQLEPDNPAYNDHFAVCLKGRLNAHTLLQSINEIINRHEALRTVFGVVNQQPLQLITPVLELGMPTVNLEELPEQIRGIQARRLAVEEARRAFNLKRGPLVRIRLLQIGGDENLLLFTVHHIISDGWSLGIFVKELTALYERFFSGAPSPLPELRIQYGDFAEWHRGWLDEKTLASDLSYWKEKMAGAAPSLDFPSDHPRPPVQTFNGSWRSLDIDPALSQSLRSLCQQEGASLFMVMLAAFKALLYRYSGQPDILVGIPVAGRNREEIETLYGCFANTVPMRSAISGNMTFQELVEQVKRTALEAYARQEVPFERLVEHLQPERDLSRSPLFQVMVAQQDDHLDSLRLPELKVSRQEIDTRVAKFDLVLYVSQSGAELGCRIEYNTNLFDASTVSQMADHFLTLLAAVTSGPRLLISSLPLLTQSELNQLLVEWNATDRQYLSTQLIHQLVERQAELTPHALAVKDEAGALTYQRLDRKANQLARYLRRAGVGPEQMVGVCMRRGVEMVVALLGVMKAGAAYVPLDTAYPKRRMSYILEDTKAGVVLADAEQAEKLSEFTGKVINVDESGEQTREQSEERMSLRVEGENLAYVIYTSGSTGNPKGVQIQHSGLVNLAAWHRRVYGVTACDRATQLASPGFDASVWELWPYLAAGASVHIPNDETRGSVSKLWQWLADEAITICFLPTPLAEAALKSQLPPNLALRAVLTGGDKLHPITDKALPFCLINHYGPTENTVVTTCAQVAVGAGPETVPPIGRPIDNTQVYLLDSHQQPIPVVAHGEIYIGGEGLARCYLDLPDLTAEKFIPNPFSGLPGARLYRTGDLARYLADGNIDFIGRTDAQVKVRGFRIELGEVEEALRQHEAVRDAVVVVRQLRVADNQIVGYVESEQPGIEEQLKRLLKERLPAYMAPSVIVRMEKIPKTHNGKVDRQQLPDPWDGKAEQEREYVRPSSEMEEVIAEIWSEALGVEKVSVTENFFDLGGHSLLATQVITRIRESLMAELPLRSLFEAGTVAELAKRVEEARRGEHLEVKPIERANREGQIPLSYAQQRLWFLDQLMPVRSAYNIATAVRLSGSLSLPGLEESLNEVIRRHEALRTSFVEEAGEARQRIAESARLEIALIDLAGVEEGRLRSAQGRLAKEEADREFDLRRAPLLRARVIKEGEREHVLLVTMHHIISDGWSIRVLINELAQLYREYTAGKPSPLEELRIQYADYAVWQREWLQGAALEGQLDYWKKRLRGAAGALELPTDRARPPAQSYRGGRQSLELSESLTEELRRLSRREGVTLFTALLAGFYLLLYRYSGEPDILVGVPVAGRNRVEIENLIGFFVNTLVLRIALDSELTFQELVEQVKRTALDAYARQEVPFERLVEHFQPERDLSRNPLFQVMMAQQDDHLDSLRLPELKVSRQEIDTQVAKFDLALYVNQSGAELGCLIEYNTDLFDSSTIERMIAHYQLLLEQGAAQPQLKLWQIQLLTPEDRRQLAGCNETGLKYERGSCLHHLVHQQAELTPDATAVVNVEIHLSYGELEGRANQLARLLIDEGAGPEKLVGLCVERSEQMILAMLGVLKAGAAYVSLDPSYPSQRINYVLEDAAAELLITQSSLIERVEQSASKLVCLDLKQEEISRQSRREPEVKVDATNLAYVLYTSGSTGRPKGVAISHASAVALVEWARQEYTPEDIRGVLASTSICFDLSVYEIFFSLGSGGTVIVSQDALGIAGQGWAERVSLINTVPSAMRELLRMKAAPASVRVVNLAGEVLHRKLAQEIYQQTGVERVYNLYGPTEDTTYSTYERVSREGRDEVTIGRPIANTAVYILDERMQEVAAGIRGEIYLGGEGLARGYWKRADLTAEKFVPSGYGGSVGERLYRTGDIGQRLRDGRIEYQGRRDNQVKVRGYRIELGEIEAVLREQSGVRDAVVVVRGEGGDKRLAAYVVAENRGDAGQEQIDERREEWQAELRRRLPAYMTPNFWVQMDRLPLTPNGKVDHRALPEPGGTARDYVAPRTPVEETLAAIWAEVLKVDRPGIKDNFFELGGHSLLATQLVSRVQKVFHVELPLRQLFEQPTIENISQRIMALPLANEASELVPIPRDAYGVWSSDETPEFPKFLKVD